MTKGIVYMDAEMDEIEETEGMNGSGFGDTSCLTSQYLLRNLTEKAFSVITEFSVSTNSKTITFLFLFSNSKSSHK